MQVLASGLYLIVEEGSSRRNPNDTHLSSGLASVQSFAGKVGNVNESIKLWLLSIVPHLYSLTVSLKIDRDRDGNMNDHEVNLINIMAERPAMKPTTPPWMKGVASGC